MIEACENCGGTGLHAPEEDRKGCAFCGVDTRLTLGQRICVLCFADVAGFDDCRVFDSADRILPDEDYFIGWGGPPQ